MGVFLTHNLLKKTGISYGYAIPYQLRLFVSKDVSNFSMLYIIKNAQLVRETIVAFYLKIKTQNTLKTKT